MLILEVINYENQKPFISVKRLSDSKVYNFVTNTFIVGESEPIENIFSEMTKVSDFLFKYELDISNNSIFTDTSYEILIKTELFLTKFAEFVKKNGLLINSVINKKILIREYVKNRLGFPFVLIQMKDVQIDQAISKALDIYSYYNPLRLRNVINVTPGVQQYTATVGRGIIDVQVPVDSLRLPGVSRLESLLNIYPYRITSQDIGDFAMSQYYLEDLRSVIISELNYIVEKDVNGNDIIIISPKPTQSFALSYVYAENRELNSIDRSDKDWFLDMCVAETKLTLGQVRIQLEGSVGSSSSVNLGGNDMYNDAKEELEMLKESLASRTQNLAPVQG